MRLVHIKSVNPKLLERDHIILLIVGLQLFELDLKTLSCSLKLLYAEPFSTALF